MSIPFIAQLFTTFALTGLILTVQVLHYPSFRFVTENKFGEFHRFHSSRISYLVIPLMVAELGCAAYFFYVESASIWSWNLGSVLLAWAFTFFVSVPVHNRLQNGYDMAYIRRLVTGNWLRTVTWCGRSLLLMTMLHG